MASYGYCRAWSILTMPAILRIFSYQMVASQPIIGSSLSYDVIVVHGGGRLGTCPLATLCRDDHRVPLFYRCWLFLNRLGRKPHPHDKRGNYN